MARRDSTLVHDQPPEHLYAALRAVVRAELPWFGKNKARPCVTAYAVTWLEERNTRLHIPALIVHHEREDRGRIADRIITAALAEVAARHVRDTKP